VTAFPTSIPRIPAALPIVPEDRLEGRVLPASGWWTLNQLQRGGRMIQDHHQLDQLAAVLGARGRGTDVYMSQGIFELPSRRAVHLSCMTHAYVDLDAYKSPVMSDGKGIDVVARLVLWDCDEWGIPRPSCIVHSGRGLYLKWFWRQPVPRAEAGRAMAINRALVRSFRDFGADPAAVDLSRILRVVGSVNSRSGKTVEVIWSNDADGNIVRYDFGTFSDAVLPSSGDGPATRSAEIVPLRRARGERTVASREAVEEHQRLGHKLFNREHWHWGVLEDLRCLAKLRHESGVVQAAGAGRRAGLDLFGHLGACQLARVIPAHRLAAEIEAWARLILPDWYVDGDFGRHCSTLLELAHRAAAGERVQHGGKTASPIWTYKKTRLLELLEINSEEMRHMTRLIDDDEKRRRDREKWRADHTGQDRAAYLAANGISNDKPWEAEGVSRATWYRRKQKQEAAAKAR